jgi:hypothetical protein
VDRRFNPNNIKDFKPGDRVWVYWPMYPMVQIVKATVLGHGHADDGFDVRFDKPLWLDAPVHEWFMHWRRLEPLNVLESMAEV